MPLRQQRECMHEFLAYNLLFYGRECPISRLFSADYGLVIEHQPCRPREVNMTLEHYKHVNHGYIEYMEPGKAACVFKLF